jgi:hypothetical protein
MGPKLETLGERIVITHWSNPSTETPCSERDHITERVVPFHRCLAFTFFFSFLLGIEEILNLGTFIGEYTLKLFSVIQLALSTRQWPCLEFL